MKRPKVITPKKAQTHSSKVVRDSKEAAISLVRLEFDVNRLTQGIEQAEYRIKTYSEELGYKLRERDRLLKIMQQDRFSR